MPQISIRSVRELGYLLRKAMEVRLWLLPGEVWLAERELGVLERRVDPPNPRPSGQRTVRPE